MLYMRGRSSAIDTPLSVVGHWTGPRPAGVAQLDAQRTGVTGWMVSGRVSLTGWPVDGCRWCGQAGLQMQARRQYDVACGCLCQPGSSHARGRAWCGSGSLQPSSRQVVGPVLWSGPQRCHWIKRSSELPGASAAKRAVAHQPHSTCVLVGAQCGGRRSPWGPAYPRLSQIVQKLCAF